MVAPPCAAAGQRQRGVLLIEVLVTLVIVSIGLLGLAGVQIHIQRAELDAYQRSQALLLLSDMVSRISTNRSHASSYLVAVSSPLGAGASCPTGTATVAQLDLAEWCNALQGAAETVVVGGVTATVGGLVNGRGCIENLSGDYLVTVAWQGQVALSPPPASVACGAGRYNGSTGSDCADDRCRRVVTTLVRLADLSP